jgi:hypothetical protein
MTSAIARGRRAIAVAAVVSAAALLSGCGSSGPQAAALMSKAGCPGAQLENPPGPGLVQSSGCSLEDGTSVQIMTFGSTRNETAWIAQWCHHFISSAGCIEGNLWVATYNSLPALAQRDRQRIVSAIGGRPVSKAA